MKHRLGAALLLAALIALTAAVYTPAILSYFQADDWGHIAMAARPDRNPWQFGGWFYRPLFVLAFNHIYDAFGTNPLPAHVVSLVFHLACTALVYVLGRRLRFGIAAALIGATVFALYPGNTEAVAWISAFSGPLALMLALLAALVLLRDEWPFALRLPAAFVLWAAACLAKQEAASLAIVIPFLPIIANPKRDKAALIRCGSTLALFLLGVGAVCLLEIHCTSKLGNPQLGLDLNLLHRATRLAVGVMPPVLNLSMLTGLWTVAPVALFAVLMWKALPSVRPGLLIFAGSAMGIGLALGHLPPADRYGYTPSVGIGLCLAAVVQKVLDRKVRLDLASWVIFGTAAIAVAACGAEIWTYVVAYALAACFILLPQEGVERRKPAWMAMLPGLAISGAEVVIPYLGWSFDLSPLRMAASIAIAMVVIANALHKRRFDADACKSALCGILVCWVQMPAFVRFLLALLTVDVLKNGLTVRKTDLAILAAMRNAAARLAVPAVVLSITVSLAWATRGSSERWYSSGIAAREIVERLVPVFESLPEGSYVYVDCKNCSIADIQDSRIFVVAAHVLAKRPDLVIERHPMNGETVTKNVAEERPDAVVLISLDNRARAFARTLTGSSVRHLRPAVKDSFRLDR